MREMGELTGADIEPPQQTLLLNLCVSQAGIIGGGVPGGKLVVHPLRFMCSCLLKLADMTLSGCLSVTQLIVPPTPGRRTASGVSGASTPTSTYHH